MLNHIFEIKIVRSRNKSTPEASLLKKALEDRGVKVYIELNDGFKTIDLALPRAKINIEVDGIQHLTNPTQILADLNRGYYSHKNGFNTMHIQNEMIRSHLDEIADALAEASKIREKKIHVYLN
jgi:very-short-patch-repair endonuclease